MLSSSPFRSQGSMRPGFGSTGFGNTGFGNRLWNRPSTALTTPMMSSPFDVFDFTNMPMTSLSMSEPDPFAQLLDYSLSPFATSRMGDLLESQDATSMINSMFRDFANNMPVTYRYDTSESGKLKIVFNGMAPDDIKVDVHDQQVEVQGTSADKMSSVRFSLSLPRPVTDAKKVTCTYNDSTMMTEIHVPDEALEALPEPKRTPLKLDVQKVTGPETGSRKASAGSGAGSKTRGKR